MRISRLLSRNEIFSNVERLAYPHLSNKKICDHASIRQGYLKFLSIHGNYKYKSLKKPLFTNYIPQGLSGYFNNSNSEEEYLKTHTSNEKKQPYKNPEERIQAVKKAYQPLGMFEPEFKDLFDLIIYQVFSDTNKSHARNSSHPSYPGFIALHECMVGSTKGLQEVLIHEFTHTVFFIDEINHSYYIDYKSMNDKLIPSGMMSVPIPVPRALHSVIVGCEILLSRDELFTHKNVSPPHPESDIIIENLKHTIDSLRDHHQKAKIFTQRPLDILDHCSAVLRKY